MRKAIRARNGDLDGRYECSSCDWRTRARLYCGRSGDGGGHSELKALRARVPDLRADHEHPDACFVLGLPVEFDSWVSMFPHYENGNFQREGGLENQDPRWLDAMKLISREVALIRQKNRRQ